MTIEQEQQLVLNPVHGASLLWRATRTYHDESAGMSGVPLGMTMLVLPLVLHQLSANAITRANKASGIGRVLLYDRTVKNQLSDRVSVLSSLTWDSLLIGHTSKLIKVVETERGYEVFPELSQKSLPAPIKPTKSELLNMLSAADRLGYWFYRESHFVISEVLQVVV